MKRITISLAAALLGLFIVPLGTVYAQLSDTTPPSTPINVSASESATVPSQINVSWSASTDNTGVAGYYVYRNGASIANTGSTNFTDAVPAGSYSYSVSAYDAAGNISGISSPSGFVSYTPDTTPPSAPVLTATTATSSIALSWTGATDNVGVVGYYVYRNNGRLAIAGPYTATTYTDTGLPVGYTFTYKVVAYDAGGNQSNSNTLTATTLSDVTPPATPQAPALTVKSQTEIDLRWQGVYDNTGVTVYNLYRGGSLIATVSGTAYADTGLSAATAYTYYLTASDAAGNVSAQGYPMAATTLQPDTSAPSNPYSLVAKTISPSEIDLSWGPSTDNVGVAGYYIDRNESQIANTTSTFYHDTGLASGTTYTYTVQAYDAAGNNSFPVPVTGVTPFAMATTPSAPVVSSVSPAVPITPSSGSTSIFTSTLYLGLRSDSVKDLQLLLIQLGDLGPAYATSYFGALTQAAVQKFQCAQNIVCSGTPGTTGWGSVGPRTRAALNAL